MSVLQTAPAILMKRSFRKCLRWVVHIKINAVFFFVTQFAGKGNFVGAFHSAGNFDRKVTKILIGINFADHSRIPSDRFDVGRDRARLVLVASRA